MKKSFVFLSTLILFVIFTSPFANQSNITSNKNSNQIKEKEKGDMSSYIINVVAAIEIKEGFVEEFTKIFIANVPNVLAEKGCIEYTPTIDVPTNIGIQDTNKNIVTIIEKWESLEHLYAHLKAAHMNTYREKVKDIVAGVSIKVLTEVPK